MTMRTLQLLFSPRIVPLTLSVLGVAITLIASAIPPFSNVYTLALLLVFGSLTALGIRDLFQTRHAILRNYPISGHLRFLLENIRPELRQYFFEGEKDGMPFPRDKRAIVYQRAKRALDKRPFGTQHDVYDNRFEWLHHSIAPKAPSAEPFRINVGGSDCRQPYSASVFNISAMSYGPLYANVSQSSELLPQHFMQRASADRTLSFAELYPVMNSGELLAEIMSPYIREAWSKVNPNSFAVSSRL